MTPQPGTAGTDDDPLDSIETKELVVNGQTIDTLVGLAFDSANQTDGVLRFDGSGSTNGITDGSAKVIVNGTVYDVAGAEWVDQSGTKHTVDSWEKVVNSQFDVTITGTNGPVQPGNTLDVTVDVSNAGTDSDTQTVTLDIDNGVGQVDSQSVTLSGGGSTTQTLSWSVPSGQSEQDYQATVSSADDTASQTVTVATAPSSVTHQYRAEDFASPWPDNVGSADMSVSGLSASTFGSGDDSVTSDGTDDVGTANGPEDLPSNQSFGLAFTFSSTDETDNTLWLGCRDSSGTPAFQIGDFDADDNSNGELYATFVDDNGNSLKVETNSSYTDGNVHLVVINKSGNNAADIDIYVDDMSTPVATTTRDDKAFDHSNYNIAADMEFHARNDDGTTDNHKALDSGLFEFNSDTYSQSERNNLKNRRPEV